MKTLLIFYLLIILRPILGLINLLYYGDTRNEEVFRDNSRNSILDQGVIKILDHIQKILDEIDN